MRSISEVSHLTGVSKRALQYYDQIGLLKPSSCTEAGYRLYDDAALERLQQILLYRELKFPLKEIKRIIQSDDFDRNRALEQQIELLMLQKEHLENLILFAKGLEAIGVRHLDFKAFDTQKLDAYAREAKETWGKTPAYKEYESKQKQRTPEADQELGEQMMRLLARFGALRAQQPDSPTVQLLVQELRDFITRHFYRCSVPILRSLGRMYSGGGSMNENIDQAGGEGTGSFVGQAIEAYALSHADEKE